MDALDNYIPQPVREKDKPFIMPVEDVFSITGRGTVATGRIERGIVKVGEEVALIGFNATRRRSSPVSRCSGSFWMKAARRQRRTAAAWYRRRRDLERGMVLAKPGSITPHTNFLAEVYVLTKEEGGRHTPFFKGYRPQFYFRTTDVTGTSSFPEGMEMVMPGDNVQMTIELITPIAMEEALRHSRGGRTVGAEAAPFAIRDLRDDPGADGSAAFSDGEAKLLCPWRLA